MIKNKKIYKGEEISDIEIKVLSHLNQLIVHQIS